MSSHWLDTVITILKSDTGDLRSLAEIAGGPIERFYVGADLSKADLRGQDLSIFDLTGADLRTALLDDRTLINPIWDPRLQPSARRVRYLALPKSLIQLVREVQLAGHRAPPGKTITTLLRRSRSIFHDTEIMNRWISVISANPSLRDLFKNPKYDRKRHELVIPDSLYTILAHYTMGITTRSSAVIFGIVVALFTWIGITPEEASKLTYQDLQRLVSAKASENLQ